MNPSASGWIKKLIKETEEHSDFFEMDWTDFYTRLKKSGFIYGSNIAIADKELDKADLTQEEICKVNLLLSYLYIHKREKNGLDDFVESTISFYKAIDNLSSNFINDIFDYKNPMDTLEATINDRVQLTDNLISKSFSYFVLNVLLFTDVLAYKKYLTESKENCKDYIKELELTVNTIMNKAVDLKEDKNEYDKSLLKLIESSSRYKNIDDNDFDFETSLTKLDGAFEKQYLIDITCMALWRDRVIDDAEKEFILEIGTKVNLKKDAVTTAINDIDDFYNQHKEQIPLLSSKNMVESFYDKSAGIIRTLIKRNRKRLLKELNESKELIGLISKSATENLSEEETKKMQKQLLDVFKTIPSLAIFLLPGGTLLLPLAAKLIPKLLPSAFDDNRVDED